jgi:hypothetical protein
MDKKLQVWWIPQIPGKPFEVPVSTVEEGAKILRVLADYDLFQLKHHIKPDFSNAGGLNQWCEEDNDWESWYYEDDKGNYFEDSQEYVDFLRDEKAKEVINSLPNGMSEKVGLMMHLGRRLKDVMDSYRENKRKCVVFEVLEKAEDILTDPIVKGLIDFQIPNPPQGKQIEDLKDLTAELAQRLKGVVDNYHANKGAGIGVGLIMRANHILSHERVKAVLTGDSASIIKFFGSAV